MEAVIFQAALQLPAWGLAWLGVRLIWGRWW